MSLAKVRRFDLRANKTHPFLLESQFFRPVLSSVSVLSHAPKRLGLLREASSSSWSRTSLSLRSSADFSATLIIDDGKWKAADL